MTLQRAGWINGHPFANNGGSFVCLGCESEFETLGVLSGHDCQPDEKRPGDDPEAMPEGYTVEGGNGGYWTLKRPDGSVIEGPSNGKFQGKDAAADAAWRDAA